MLYEYLAIIPPPAFVCSSIMNLKQEGEANHNWNSATLSKAHITLSNFIQPLSLNDIIVNNYERLAAAASPFKIHLSGFGHFSTHTIYVKLIEDKKIYDLANNIKSFTKAVFKKVPNYPPYTMSIPHLTIAKGIREKDFFEAWPMWKKKEYQAQFNATRIRLLKRPYSNVFQNYEIIGDFLFTGLGILDSQLQIF